jgi:RNA polymerase sigma factor (sigma-70 family)
LPPPGSAGGLQGFASTEWSLVLAARDGEAPAAEAALSNLCSAYWRPLYAYVRRGGRSVEDAQDLTQSFFSHLLEKRGLRHVDPSLGKFRTFLLASLSHFLTNEWRRENARKRGGQAQFLSIEDMTRAENSYAAGLSSAQTPERVYLRNWALAVLERTAMRLAAEFSAAGKERVFEQLKPCLTGDRDGPRYAELAAALEMSEVAVRVAVHRMRGRFRDLLQQEVAQTLAEPGDAGAVEEELRFLLAAL